MEILASARIVIWEGASLWIVDVTPARAGVVRRTSFHAHHAIQVTLGLGGRFRLDTEELHVPGAAVAVAADAPHVFEAEGLIGHVFIEPESSAGRAIKQQLFKGEALVAIPPVLFSDFCAQTTAAYQKSGRDDAALVSLGRNLVAALAGDVAIDEPDARIGKVIAWAARQIDEPVGLSGAVAVSGLSASRLRHLFVEQTGLPFKTYLLWLRLTRAVEIRAAGASLTEAAHQAGFSDSAHFSRTFRRMFGIAPAALKIA